MISVTDRQTDRQTHYTGQTMTRCQSWRCWSLPLPSMLFFLKHKTKYSNIIPHGINSATNIAWRIWAFHWKKDNVLLRSVRKNISKVLCIKIM